MIAKTIEHVAITKIEVGVRRRQKLGNVKSLAKSIEARGLLHPILIRNGRELVAGQRRLEACKILGWSTVPARDVTGCDDEELRAIELEENTERLDLMDTERAVKAKTLLVQAAAEAEKEAELREDSSRKSRGRPAEAGSRRDVAERTGIAPAAQRNIEKHVALAEEYPVFKRREWRQYNVLEAGEKLATLPVKDRSAAAALIDQDAIPPKTAIEIINNLVEMKPAERREVFTLATSDDPHDHRIALTKAAAVPPPPDPGLLLLLDGVHTLGRAAKLCRVEAFKIPMQALVSDATTLAKSFRAHVEAHRDG